MSEPPPSAPLTGSQGPDAPAQPVDGSAPAGHEPVLHIDGARATITLRRPAQANRLELGDLDRLLEQLARIRALDGTPHAVRVLCLRAEGRHFCSGFHLGQVGASAAQAVERFEAVADALEQARPVTVAAIQGGAFGGAVDLALACDFRIGTSACEMFIPAARLGLHFYGGGLRRLVTRLGPGPARRLLLAAQTLDAQALQHCGLLDEVVDPAALTARTSAFCEELAALAPLALLPMKRHLNDAAHGRLNSVQLAEDIRRALDSADLQEGARAWSARRQPRFEGR